MEETYLRELVAIARSCDAYILSDEVYRSFDERLKVPAIVDLYEKGISVNSLSKTYSLPGLRVGWVACHSDLADKLRDYRDYTMICAGVFDDMLATLALKNRSAILERNKQIVTTNLKLLIDWVAKEEKASLIAPANVSTAFVKLAISQPVEVFCLDLLEKYGVLVVPGNRFDLEGYVRIGYCCDQEILLAALEKLSQALHINGE